MTEKQEPDGAEEHENDNKMKSDVNRTELNFWRITTVVLAILFVISLYTNGFKFAAAEQTVPTTNQPAVTGGVVAEKSAEDTSTESVTDSLAKCLTEKGVAMYGAEWCSHCQNQKKLFGDSFQYINWVDCDKESAKCNEAGIQGYPTWVINGNNYPGEQTFERLAQLSGCPI